MTDLTRRDEFPALAPAEARLGRGFARPKWIAVAAIGALAALGWAYLGLMVAGMAAMGEAGDLGPGMGLFDWLARPDARDALGRALLDSLCRPTFGGHFGMPGSGAWSALDLGLVVLMWAAMALAMMLPTAGPMILSYAEIADTASAKGEPIVSPFVLAAGYLAVWIAAALGFALAQWGLTSLALLDRAMASVSALFAGSVFLVAGLYQFSSLKHACVTACQRPMPFFLANWATTPSGVFRLGLRQGLFCLGCCWTLMAVMFAVGAMNIVWMTALGVVMLIEKVSTSVRFSRAIGAALLAVGAVTIGLEIAAHWPRAA